jgi:hypothetical protein
MLRQRWRVSPLGSVLVAAPLVAACADGVPIDELFPVDAGSKPSIEQAGNAGGSGLGSIDNNGSIDMGTSGAGGSGDNGSAGSSASGGAAGSSAAGSGGGGAPGGSGGGGSAGSSGSVNHGGSAGSGGAVGGCTAPAWDSMTVYCGQGVVGTEVSLNGKKYTCHYWTQAQNPEDHNSADNSEPWSTPTDCP